MTRHQREGYYTAKNRAEYYRWAALRGVTIPGNDPIDGKPRKSLILSHRCESRVAYIAMAKYWLDYCAAYRATHGAAFGGA